MKFVDYHVHSNFSCDGKSTLFEMSQRAIDLGIEEIGFSDHMDFEPKDWGFGFFNYERYTSEIHDVQEYFKDKLVIRKGVEIDYQRCFEDEVKEWLQDKKFDFIIGSVHYLNHEIIGHKLVKSNTLKTLYDVYFKEVYHSIESGLFNVLGHFDLVSRYIDNERTARKSFDYRRKVNSILGEIVKKTMYLEVNSKGLRETYKDTTPSKDIVKSFINNGGTLLSIGSDAHSTQELGRGIKEIMGFLENSNGKKFKLLASSMHQMQSNT